jgi:carnitine-CoA ligase
VVDTVHSLLELRARSQPATPFVRCGAQWTTFADMADRANHVAAGMTELDVAPGDRVAVLLPNRQEFLDVFFGCSRFGAVVVPLNIYLKGEFLRHQLAHSGATVLVTDAAGITAAAPVLSDTAVRHIVAVDGDCGTPHADCTTGEGVDVVGFHTLLGAAGRRPEPVTDESHPAAILYTSGTTGPAKGCVVSHGYLARIATVVVEQQLVVASDRVYTSLPLFHMAALARLMNALAAPASVVYEAQFSASRYLEGARSEGATVLFGVGPMAVALLAQSPREDDAQNGFRLATFTPMTAEAKQQFEQRFATPVVCESFGQTECAQITATSPNGPSRSGTMGRALPHLEVRLHDEHDQPVAAGEVGEIVVRPRLPHSMFSGYWNDPAGTTSAWRNLWHHTGDLARVDTDGFFTYVDRKKDALRRRGENVSSQELESAIRTHPAVKDAAVVAEPSALGDDDIHAYLVCHNGQRVEPAEFFDFLRGAVPYFAVPRYVTVIDQMPVTATGKIIKHTLRTRGAGPHTWDFDQLGLVVARHERR